MKTLITILFLSLLSSPSWSETMDDLVKREGIFYKKFSDVPFSGKVTGSYKGLIKNGKKEDSWSYFYENGQLAGKGNWKKGKQEGVWVYYFDDGGFDASWSGTFKNGVKVSD